MTTAILIKQGWVCMLIPNCTATGVGSLPYTSAVEAVEEVLRCFPKLPYWPQLSQRTFTEQMYLQFSEGLPGLIIDEIQKKFYIQYDNGIYEKLGDFLEKALTQDLELFKLTDKYALGFNEFLKADDKIKKNNPLAVKGQITGPVSLGLGVTDQNKKPILYYSEYMDIIYQMLLLKSRYQIKKLKTISPRLILSVDEPYLSSLDSGLININKKESLNYIKRIFEELSKLDILTGVHCCGNADWGMISTLGVNILSFDAFSYGEKLLLYVEELVDFVKNGGFLAWGIVPTSKEINNQNINSLNSKMEEFLSIFDKKGLRAKDILKASFITPSCGTGTLNKETSQKVNQITQKLSLYLQEKYL